MSQVVLLFRSPLQDVATLGFEIDTVNIFTSCSRWQHQCDDCHRGHSCARSERKGLQMVWIPAKSPEYSSAKSSSKRMTNGNVMDAGAVVRNSSVDDHNRHTHTVKCCCGGVPLGKRCGRYGWATLVLIVVLAMAQLGSLRCAEGAAAAALSSGANRPLRTFFYIFKAFR